MKFGDLISYSRGLYTHWAVYTGNKDGKDMGIQFTGEPGLNSKEGAKVMEGPLENGGKVNNQLDGILQPQSQDEMKATIAKIKREGVGKYDVIGNNCEHLATLIRYGTAQSLQADRALTNQRNFQDEVAGTFGAPFH